MHQRITVRWLTTDQRQTGEAVWHRMEDAIDCINAHQRRGEKVGWAVEEDTVVSLRGAAFLMACGVIIGVAVACILRA